MVSKKSSFIIAAIVTIFSFITVAYVSCSKPSNGPSCMGVVCQNNGYCHVDTNTHQPYCLCPTGYEGAYCETVSVKKYLGTWNVTQVVIGSDSSFYPGYVGRTYNYTAFLEQTATPTTFFINNVSNDPYYTDIICTVDSTPSSHFFIDTISAFHMLYDHYSILYGYGDISTSGTSISAQFATRHLSATSNWIHDTFSLNMTLVHPF